MGRELELRGRKDVEALEAEGAALLPSAAPGSVKRIRSSVAAGPAKKLLSKLACCYQCRRRPVRVLRMTLAAMFVIFVAQLFWGAKFLEVSKLRGMFAFFIAESAHVGLPHIQHADSRFSDPTTAFALLGLGAMASQLKCEAAVESLGSIGGWSGRVYLFTDKPECLQVEETRRASGVDLRIVHIDGDYSGAFSLPSLGATKGNRLRAKLLKSRLFKEIGDESVERIVYMDCDEVVAVPGCVEPMVKDMFANWSAEENIRFRINSPGGRKGQFTEPDKFGIHAGFFAARRDTSWKTLEGWESELSTMKYAHDRLAFLAKMKKVQEEVLARNGTIDGEENYMKVGTWRTSWERFLDVRIAEPTCVVHVSHKRCLWQGRSDVQSFIDRLDLDTYRRNDAQYCESVLTYPLTLGWVPYHSCRKIETIM